MQSGGQLNDVFNLCLEGLMGVKLPPDKVYLFFMLRAFASKANQKGEQLTPYTSVMIKGGSFLHQGKWLNGSPLWLKAIKNPALNPA